MKKLLAVIGVLVVLAIIAVVLVFQFTSGLPTAVDEFFGKVKAKDFSAAYKLTAKEFQASTAQEQLSRFLTESELMNYAKASWSSRSISGNQGELEGSIETTNGGVVPLKVTLVKEQGAWKILSIKKAGAGLFTDTLKSELPPDQELKQLVKTTMQHFALAINARDFGDFHKHISNLWQAQISKDKLLDIFKTFSEQNIDLTVLQPLEPAFSEKPSVNADGVLIMKGKYATQPSVTTFELKYITEQNRWKLVGIDVSVK